MSNKNSIVNGLALFLSLISTTLDQKQKTTTAYQRNKNEKQIQNRLGTGLYTILVTYKIKATVHSSHFIASNSILYENLKGYAMAVDRFLMTRVMMVKWPMSGHVESSSSF